MCLITIASMLLFSPLSAQKPDTTTTLQHRHLVEPSTDFDQRFSLIHQKQVNIWGQKLGVILNQKYKVGLGAYYMNDKNIQRKSELYSPETYLKWKLEFGMAYFEPFLIRRKYFDISLPFELGYGKSILHHYNINSNNLLKTEYRDFLPAGVGLSLFLKPPAFFHFQPFTWIGINFLAGYRYCILQDTFKTDYDGWFYSIGGAIFLDKIYRYAKDKHAINLEKRKTNKVN